MTTMTISEAAVALGVSADTVRRRVQRGELQATQDERGRMVVSLDGLPEWEEPVPGNASARAMELAHLREMLTQASQERDRAVEQADAWREQAQRAADERGELLRALQQQQLLHAQAAGLKLLTSGDEVVAEPVERPRRRWFWERRNP